MTKLMTMALAAIVLVSTMATSADAGWRRRCCCANFGYSYGYGGGYCATGHFYNQSNWQTAYYPQQNFQNFCTPVSFSGQTVDPYYSR